MDKPKLYNGLPLYRLILNDDVEGLRYNSFVEDPAIDVVSNALWVAFSKEKEFKVELNVNSEKRIVTGPTMIPNIPIYRKDINGQGPGYIYMTAEDIEKSTIQFSDNNFKNKNNVEHKKGTEINSTVEIEKWIIVDSNFDKAKALGFNLPVGTQMTSTYFKDENLWKENVKTGKWKGYSIEGVFALEQSADNKIKINKNKNNIMSNTKKTTLVKLATEVVTTGGIKLIISDETPMVGSEVLVIDAEGNQAAAADQTWELENGWKIVTVDGKISEIMEPVANEDTPADAAVEQKATVKMNEETIVKLNSTLEDIIKRLTAMETSFATINKSVESVTESVEQHKVMLTKIPGSKFTSAKTDNAFPGKKVELASQKPTLTKKYSEMSINEKAEYLRNKNK